MARTTMRSSKGKKLYAKRDKKGQFTDIQTYKRAHGQDVKRKSKAESGSPKPSVKKRLWSLSLRACCYAIRSGRDTFAGEEVASAASSRSINSACAGLILRRASSSENHCA